MTLMRMRRAYSLTFDHENVIIYFVWGIDYWIIVTYLWGMSDANSGITRCTRIRTMPIDRSEAARALAKAIAFKQCGKDTEAAVWARKLIEALELAEILK